MEFRQLMIRATALNLLATKINGRIVKTEAYCIVLWDFLLNRQLYFPYISFCIFFQAERRIYLTTFSLLLSLNILVGNTVDSNYLVNT